MLIRSLEIAHLRNLQSIQFSPHSSVNFIIGDNGSGKTSLLEGISLLSRGRSFRTPHIKKVISHGCNEITVFGEVASLNADTVHRMGIQRSVQGDTLVKINGERCDRLSDLALLLPVVEIEASSFDILDGGPSVRRELLDWGLFHVEHRFLEIWKRYKAALEQKSALLRKGETSSVRAMLAHWNQQLALSGEQLDSVRSDYALLLGSAIEKVSSQYFNLNTLQVAYRSGWNKSNYASLLECLERNEGHEVEQRRALYGPHRADIELFWEGQPARDICSRGQKKLVLYAVRLAQVMVLQESKQVAPILLLDDLPAELDKINIEKVSNFLSDYPCQSFITAIDKDIHDSGLLSTFGSHHMFHVEHGQLKQPY